MNQCNQVKLTSGENVINLFLAFSVGYVMGISNAFHIARIRITEHADLGPDPAFFGQPDGNLVFAG